MAQGFRIVMSRGVQQKIETLPQVDRATRRVADRIRDDAYSAAPKDTGAGAASLAVEGDQEPGGVIVYRVSWAKEKFYMAFAELGTVHETPRPFLRPAAEKFRHH